MELEIKTAWNIWNERLGEYETTREQQWVSLDSLKADKELMINLCDCDRAMASNDYVHLKGCKYVGFLKALEKQQVEE